MKRVYAREEVCMGCKLCEVYCATAHSEYPLDLVKAFLKQKMKPLPRILVENNLSISFALQCRHCDEAPCTKACITGAMQKDSVTGIVSNDERRCVGCWTCILVCPFGAIGRDNQGHKVASKCDLCSNVADQTDTESFSNVPVCVQNCPNRALQFMDSVVEGEE
ncbi:4Fe-4S dicluster domain-containing protein [Desulfosporosinus sp.]|uniref:4Fe-4S dicluster domain-containing protein n=1 Tax=Desulfosporosinus sp. TaxID=157907 RepID=UPI0025C25F6B|nr:4Fe-4S dicluster domain-containing protein [Desulfosporosinus sp.]MBC2722558.1 4Fe-4S dicluster domain-containing protein [Desulfosporosinus sp.]MBC2726619.1 4Fe-4S dicluster domain-containing protein [Desulfosporosinus sp.]